MLSTTIHTEPKGAGFRDSKGHTKLRLLSTDQSNAAMNSLRSARLAPTGSRGFQLVDCGTAIEQPSNGVKANALNQKKMAWWFILNAFHASQFKVTFLAGSMYIVPDGDLQRVAIGSVIVIAVDHHTVRAPYEIER